MLQIENDNDRTWNMWISYVREAMSCIDDTGNFLHLPEAGGYYNQDEFIMQVWQCVRAEYLNAKIDSDFMKSIRAKYGKS